MDEAEQAEDVADEEWPPRTNRLRAIGWRGEAHLDRGEYFAAASALAEAFELVGPGEDEMFRGLHHLAAAGYRHQTGEPERAARQLAYARRRLSSFPEHADRVSVVERLLAS